MHFPQNSHIYTQGHLYWPLKIFGLFSASLRSKRFRTSSSRKSGWLQKREKNSRNIKLDRKRFLRRLILSYKWTPYTLSQNSWE